MDLFAGDRLITERSFPWPFPVMETAASITSQTDTEAESVASEPITPVKTSTRKQASKSKPPVTKQSVKKAIKNPKYGPITQSTVKDTEAYKCSRCYYANTNWQQFEAHMKSHDISPLFNCTIPNCWFFSTVKMV